MNKQDELDKEVLKELNENRKKTQRETTPEWELNLPDGGKAPKRKPGRPKRKDK